MFTEEVGVSPLAGDGGALYRARVSELVAAGRAFARIEDGEVLFKAEIGAVTPEACQVQGVWVAPHRRGQRLSVGGMAAVVAQARVSIAPVVSLYVNDYTPRRARRIGGSASPSAGVHVGVVLAPLFLAPRTGVRAGVRAGAYARGVRAGGVRAGRTRGGVRAGVRLVGRCPPPSKIQCDVLEATRRGVSHTNVALDLGSPQQGAPGRGMHAAGRVRSAEVARTCLHAATH
jgi:hypothetical protein